MIQIQIQKIKKSSHSIVEDLSSTFWLAIGLLLMAVASKGCHHDSNSGNWDQVQVSSVGNIALLTSENPGAEDDFGPAEYDAVYEFSFTGGLAIVTASEDLEIVAAPDVEVWEVVPGSVTQFESIIRSYITYEGWTPDLFPASYSGVGDLQAMMTAFACADGIDLPEFAPFECPSGFIPDTLFRRVSNGDYFWSNPGTNKVLFLVKL